MSQGPTNSQRTAVAEALAGAVRQWQAGRLAEAEAALRKVLSQVPEQGDALHLLGVIAHQSGRTAAGIELIERALRASPGSAPFHGSIAKLYRAIGSAQKAIEHGQRAVSLKGDNADAHLNLGLARFDAGDFSRAIESFDAALRLRPQLAEAVNRRGNALRALGRYGEAEADYRRALKMTPSYPEALNNLGTVLRNQARLAEAEAAFRAALVQRPNYVLAANNLVVALREQRKFDEAIAAAQQALQLSPRNADALSYLGAIYLDLGDTEPALTVLRESLAINPSKAETHNSLGRALVEAGRMDEAMQAFRTAIALRPEFGDPHNNLGNALRDLGDFDAALGEFETALKLEPDAVLVYNNLVDVKKFRAADDPHLRAMEAAAATIETLPAAAQVQLHFALGKAYDDLKGYDDAFAHFRKGNALHRASIAYDEPAMLGFFERTRAVFTPDLMAAKAGGGAQSALPIFVVGMPRSGTTLVEQIIAGHSLVKGAGETRELDAAVAAVRAGEANALRYPEIVPSLTAAELTQIGADYAARLQRHAPGAARIVDKLPTNFHFLGLIHLALPNAKVVHIRRDALDTCVSCFSKMFTAAQNHTYDLAELGRYWRSYDTLMGHWRRVLPPGAFLDVDYEALVGDIEAEARRIFAFLDLDWDANALAFQQRGTVRTASSYQVRQPLFASAIARWRHYEKHLAPLMREVGRV